MQVGLVELFKENESQAKADLSQLMLTSIIAVVESGTSYSLLVNQIRVITFK